MAKQKVDAALLIGGKLKHKSGKNNPEGFESLSQWLHKQGVDCLQVCLEATGSYGNELALYLAWMSRSRRSSGRNRNERICQ